MPATKANSSSEITYQARSARSAAWIPAELQCWTERAVYAVSDGQQPRQVGWIVTDPGGHDQTGSGPYACYMDPGQDRQMPAAYVRNVPTIERGERVIGDADYAAALLRKPLNGKG
jgi:hypothetical protein